MQSVLSATSAALECCELPGWELELATAMSQSAPLLQCGTWSFLYMPLRWAVVLRASPPWPMGQAPLTCSTEQCLQRLALKVQRSCV